MKKLSNIILIVLILFSTYKLIQKMLEYDKAKNLYDKVQVYNPINDDNLENFICIKKREENLISINKEYRLWIKVDGTNINYPVVQGDNNEYYLSHDFNKNKNNSGCIFVDYRNDLKKDKNLIFYGHNMKDNSMFQQLEKFKNKIFFDRNKCIYIKEDFTLNKYEIFSVCILDSKDNYLKVSFEDDNTYDEYLKKIRENSLNYRDINISYDDKIITLSTCGYDFKGARIVVYGKLII